LLFVDFSTARAIHQFASKPNAVNITLTGHQWWWEIRYEDEQPQNIIATANEIHIPTGRPVKIVLQSADVIHSFWIPNLTGKKDMIPNHSTEIWFQADKPGMYWGQCAEFCGFEHAKMRLFVIADPPEVFDGWLNAARTPSRPPLEQIQKEGQQVFMLKQCSMCHTIVGTPAGGRVGPDLTHLMNRYTLAAGAIRNTPGQLAGWILDPQVIKPGCRMPQNNLSPHDLQALLEYLRTLQ
jgi:cytochrome c oxidase subunit 2